MATPQRLALIKLAVLTSPLIGMAMATPLIIFLNLHSRYLLLVFAAATAVLMLAWTVNILLLGLRPYFGKYPWLQFIIASGIMMVISIGVFALVQPELPESAKRLPMIRYVNVFVVNGIIYLLINLRLLIDSRTRLAEENARLRFSSLETQYKLLKEQINPHFLFNALGTAKSLIRRDPQLAENYIIRLSDFLRASLNEAPDTVTVKAELKLVRDYIELQQMRFRDSLEYECTVQASSQSRMIPFFSLLTLVENAVKHNAMTPEMPLKIQIHDDGVSIIVTNQLQAKPTGNRSPKSGLHNLSERCRVLGYGDLGIHSENGYYEVRMNLGPNAQNA